jgi:hypothetical protein
VIRLPFPPRPDLKWSAWVEQCVRETEVLVNRYNAGATIEVKRLYRAQRARLLKLSAGKCVYCESLISANQRGDIDHFRPKAGVTDVDHRPVLVTLPGGRDGPHPGYYWLAYTPNNLLPSCILCNQPTGRRAATKGKWSRFPVDGKHAIAPGEEAQEKPLLLHPYIDDPQKHIRVTPEGVLVPQTNRGDMTIAILDLNRDALVSERARTYHDVTLTHIQFLTASITNSPTARGFGRRLKDYLDGLPPYSAAGRQAIIDALEKYKQLSSQLVASELSAVKP